MTELTGWLIYREDDLHRNTRFIELLQTAAKQRGIHLIVRAYENIDMNLQTIEQPFVTEPGESSPSFIINRAVAPWLNEVSELAGIRCFNRAHISRIANDKRLAHAHLSKLGIPMLPTRARNRRQVLRERGAEPIIAKDPVGRGGTGVKLVSLSDSIASIQAALPEHVVEQPVGGIEGKDLRVYIVGGEMIAAVLRHSQTDFRANISQGGTSTLVTLTKPERAVVNQITASFELDFVGLDFLIGTDGKLLFNEMEDAVGCRGLYIASEINIADHVMAHIATECRKP